MMTSRAKSPCFSAFRATRAFPSSVVGPVDRWALRRFASIFLMETTFAELDRGLVSPDSLAHRATDVASIEGAAQAEGCGRKPVGSRRSGYVVRAALTAQQS